ncbi:hypothetical protein ACWGR4_24305 [Embleya sp. NPDC055664]
MVDTEVAGRPQLAFRFELDRDYGHAGQFYGIEEQLSVSTPLGNGLIGMASDLQGWMQIPPCTPGGESWYAWLRAQDVRITEESLGRDRFMTPGRAGNRERIASTMVRLTNSVRRRAG